MELIEDRRRRSLISLTPLIDVVFILLVFFMLASSFIDQRDIKLSIGESESIEINKTEQSIIKVGLNHHYVLNEKAMKLEHIIARLENQLHTNKNHLVLIQPDDQLPLQALVTIVDKIGKIAGNNMSLIRNDA